MCWNESLAFVVILVVQCLAAEELKSLFGIALIKSDFRKLRDLFVLGLLRVPVNVSHNTE